MVPTVLPATDAEASEFVPCRNMNYLPETKIPQQVEESVRLAAYSGGFKPNDFTILIW